MAISSLIKDKNLKISAITGFTLFLKNLLTGSIISSLQLMLDLLVQEELLNIYTEPQKRQNTLSMKIAL